MSRTWFRGVRRGHSSSHQSRKAPGLIPARFRPVIEVLEARDLPSTFLVTTAADSGAGSLRAAILSANNHPEGNTIDFDIASGVQRIHLESPLPAIAYPVILDGSTQPGFSAVPLVVLDGTFAGPSADALTITGGDSTVRDLVIHGFGGSGIVLSGQGGNAVTGNYIGTTAAGNQAFANGERGIYINSSSHNTIGGTTTGSGNVISENGWTGILIDNASQNVIEGNKIGTDVTGTQPLGNAGFGIRLHDGTDNQIGGTTSGARNVISANALSGVFIGIDSTGNVLQGNYIGTDVSGSAAMGNERRGVEVSGASDNTIGGTAAGAGNVISANSWAGLVLEAGTTGALVQENFIGTDATGTQALANGGHGIRVDGANDNTIGGTTLHSGNVISGNGMSGLYIGDGSFGNQVQGNHIGTTVSGLAALGNGERGVLISGASNNDIGGTEAGSGNLISGNAMAGVLIEQDASGNQVQGNLIGTDQTGTSALANGAAGVRIADSSNNLVGGTVAGAANVISGNDQDGVNIDELASSNLVQGNWIGTGADGTTSLGNGGNGVAIANAVSNTIGGTVTGAANTIAHNLQNGVLVQGPLAASNTITANMIFANNLGGILLFNGGNGTATSPTLGASVVFGSTAMVEGALVATASTTYVIDFYANTDTDASGHDEGQTFLGSAQVTTGANGVAIFNVTLDLGSSSGQSITATATDPIGNTSAFSTAAPTTQL
jgi:parallel beta-helix repeat protein